MLSRRAYPWIRWCVGASLLITGTVTAQVHAQEQPADHEGRNLTHAQSLISPQDFRLYMQWRVGKGDARLSTLSHTHKIQKIAHAAGVEAHRLQQAIDAGEKAAPTLAYDVEQAIRRALHRTPLADRIRSIEVNTEHEHVVAGLKWRCGPDEARDQEAAYAAWAVSTATSLVDTLAAWCVSDHDQKLFSAKIGRSAFARINIDHIPRFAAARYIRLFEDVKKGAHD